MTGHESQLVLKALEQMMNKGTVSSEELRHQLGDRIPGAFELFAKSMGVSTQKLGEMMKKGEVLTKDTLPKFIDLLGDTFSSGAEKNANSLVAAQNRLNNAADKYNTILGEKIKPGLELIYSIQKQIYDLGIKAMGGEPDEKKGPTTRELVQSDLARYKYEGVKNPAMPLASAQSGLLGLYDKKISELIDKLPQLRLEAAGTAEGGKQKLKLKKYKDALTAFNEKREELLNYMGEDEDAVTIVGKKKAKGKKGGEKLRTDYHTPKILNINILTGDGASMISGNIQTDINTMQADSADIRQNVKDQVLASLNDMVNDTAVALARVAKSTGVA
jgi:tape measure domain-containing protein